MILYPLTHSPHISTPVLTAVDVFCRDLLVRFRFFVFNHCVKKRDMTILVKDHHNALT